jgi:hypothetical protein
VPRHARAPAFRQLAQTHPRETASSSLRQRQSIGVALIWKRASRRGAQTRKRRPPAAKHKSLDLEQRFRPVLESLFDLMQELMRDRPVHDAVVVA